MENRPIQAPGRPWGTIVSLLTALIYGASPIDIIPDLIPLLGWTDDVAVVATLVAYAGVAYLRWKRGQGIPPMEAWPGGRGTSPARPARPQRDRKPHYRNHYCQIVAILSPFMCILFVCTEGALLSLSCWWSLPSSRSWPPSCSRSLRGPKKPPRRRPTSATLSRSARPYRFTPPTGTTTAW